MLFCVPISQALVELGHRQSPLVFDIFKPISAAVVRAAAKDWRGAREALATVVERQFPKTYEGEIEHASIARNFFQPRIQALITKSVRFGNDQTVLGRGGWLFYQPGVDYLTGPDIIDSRYLLLSMKKMVDKNGERQPQPDPRPAILQLNAECMRRGIRLVVVPIPEKAMLQPSELTGRMDFSGSLAPPNNRGYARFAHELRAAGVDMFDVAPDTVRPGEVRYLAQDTHWTPGFMDTVAARIANHIAECTQWKPAAARPSYSLAAVPVSRVGDLVDMLKLPRDQQFYRPETVVVQQVLDRNSGQAWRPDPEAEILLLGDSFTNIYSLPAMGWGASAGLAEHISYRLRRSLDVIAVNGGGASGARMELSRVWNSERLVHKKVLVYEFAMRSLMNENWRLAQFPPPTASGPGSSPSVAPDVSAPPVSITSAATPPSNRAAASHDATTADAAAPQQLTIEGRVTKTSLVPKPGTAPYKDCLTFIRVHIEKTISGSYEKPDLIAVFRAMKDDRWLPAASYSVGDRLRLTVTPLRLADRQLQAMQRADDLDDYTLDPYFVVNGGKL
jgi:alginate O-acetyltransferase complex protein AlgJ